MGINSSILAFMLKRHSPARVSEEEGEEEEEEEEEKQEEEEEKQEGGEVESTPE